MSRTRWLLGVALLLGLATVAAPEERPPEERPRWEFEFAPYAWLAGNYGSLTVKGHVAQVSVSPIDVYHLLELGNAFAGTGYLAARYERWSVFSDSLGGYAEEGITERIPTQLCTLSVAGRGKMRFVIADFGLGYELGRWALPGRRKPFTLGVYAGTRYQYFNAKLSVSGGVVGGIQRAGTAANSWAWADPLIGVRWSVPVLDRLSLDFRGDIGGFGASSRLIWGLVGGVRYWLPWSPLPSIQPYLGLGYRLAAFERDFGTDNSIDLQFRGPTSSGGFVF